MNISLINIKISNKKCLQIKKQNFFIKSVIRRFAQKNKKVVNKQL